MKTILRARINHGRWIVDCPRCGGAEIARVGVPFVCKGATPGGFHGESTPCGFEAIVEFPVNKLAIEDALLPRELAFRNWEPGETLDTLKQENAEHGL